MEGQAKGAIEFLKLTDVNDAAVLGTAILGNPMHLDGSPASTDDVYAAYRAAMVPGISGSALRKLDKIDDIHRIGGNSVDNLTLKAAEKKLDPPGISVLKADTPQEAAQQLRDANPNATRLHEASKTVGSTNAEKIREAGFDIIHAPSKTLPNHHRIIHPEGAMGFHRENLERLSKAMTNSKGN